MNKAARLWQPSLRSLLTVHHYSVLFSSSRAVPHAEGMNSGFLYSEQLHT